MTFPGNSENTVGQNDETSQSDEDFVRWHDVECGSYTEDFPVWQQLAKNEHDPILDIGAGTGRVSLLLAKEGHKVTALDREQAFIETLSQRAKSSDLAIKTIVADATDFTISDTKFGLIIVPMSTIALLRESTSRKSFFSCAHDHLQPGGLIALALTEEIESFDV
jgi:2-polyprenyl-3-methyl-5-hydroxy-6-metoxy-1,4-benzoquinol methylase